MAELLLKIDSTVEGDQTTYQDGDILCAQNNRKIKTCHAQHICRPNTRTQANFYNALSSLAKKYFDKTHQYRMERVSATEVKIITLSDMSEKIVGPTPNADGEYMRVNQLLPKLIANERFMIFGSPGSEVWYGGHTDFTENTVDSVWDDIENDTPNLRTNFTLWPFTPIELRQFLALSIDDFTDAIATFILSPETEEIDDPAKPGEGRTVTRIIKKRRWQVPWDTLQEFRQNKEKQDVRNKDLAVDRRLEFQINRATAARLKL